MLIVYSVSIITALVILATGSGITIGQHTQNDELSSPIGLTCLVLVSGGCLSILLNTILTDYHFQLNTTAVVIGAVLTVITLIISSMATYIRLRRTSQIIAH